MWAEYRVEDRTLRPGESTILRNNDLVVVGDIQFLAKSFGEECVMLQDGNFLCLSVQGTASYLSTPRIFQVRAKLLICLSQVRSQPAPLSKAKKMERQAAF